MELRKRDCGINMRLVPYGGGWTDVYLDIAGDSHYFIISNVMGDQFDDLLAALYSMYPNNNDNEKYYKMEYKYAFLKYIDGEYVTEKIVDEVNACGLYCDVPWKATFSWDDEGGFGTSWCMEREPDEKTDFILHIDIVSEKSYHYDVRYADFCYAVAKACTETLKKHGFWGYHKATYTQDINVRRLLLLKAIALENMEARELTHYKEKDKGETCDFEKEMELLLFDM